MPLYELCEYQPIRVIGYGWVSIAEFETEEQAQQEKGKKENPNNFMVRKKKELREYSIPGIIIKSLPKGHNLSATQRRNAWNSNDPKEFRKIM